MMCGIFDIISKEKIDIQLRKRHPKIAD